MGGYHIDPCDISVICLYSVLMVVVVQCIGGRSSISSPIDSLRLSLLLVHLLLLLLPLLLREDYSLGGRGEVGHEHRRGRELILQERRGDGCAALGAGPALLGILMYIILYCVLRRCDSW